MRPVFGNYPGSVIHFFSLILIKTKLREICPVSIHFFFPSPILPLKLPLSYSFILILGEKKQGRLGCWASGLLGFWDVKPTFVRSNNQPGVGLPHPSSMLEISQTKTKLFFFLLSFIRIPHTAPFDCCTPFRTVHAGYA